MVGGRSLWVGILILGVVAPVRGGPDAQPERAAGGAVELKTADRMRIAATFHRAGDPGGAGAVLVPMRGDAQASWAKAIRPLQDRGISVLALDLRGHGKSAKQGRRDLAKRVAKGDKALFKAMHKDLRAAIGWLAKEGGCDPERIVLVGAGAGFSVALDAARRHPEEVAALVGLSPVGAALGLDPQTCLAKLPDTLPMLLLVQKDEVGLCADATRDQRPALRLVVYDEPRPEGEAAGPCGTRMLGAMPLAELTVASFAALATGSEIETVLLDGIVEREGEHADPWKDAVDVGPSIAPGCVHAYRVGRRVVFGGRVRKAVGGLRFEVQTGNEAQSVAGSTMLGPPQVVAVDLSDGQIAWSWGGMGSVPNFPGVGGKPLFGKTVPRLRVVHGEDWTTFEGEWYVPPFAGESPLIRLRIELGPEAPSKPEGGMLPMSGEGTKNLPSRT